MPEGKRPARIAVAAPHRSSGKSTVSIGLLAALRARGLAVQPFKKGPDYIDPMWHSAAAGRLSRNLDFFLMGPEGIAAALDRHARGADAAVIECNHGLHDGADPAGADSGAALARLLDAAVVLVVNARRLGRGVAALVRGQTEFDPGVRFAGIVLNQVRGRRHEGKLRDALERYCRVEVLGALPDLPELEIKERHLGLTPLHEAPRLAPVIRRIGEATERHLDLDRLLAVAGVPRDGRAGGEAAGTVPPLVPAAPHGARVRLGVAMDRAFTYYYPENFEALAEAGAELVPFSPLRDAALPRVDGLYLGGGFPEFFLGELEANAAMRGQVRAAVQGGLPVWAECGGLMYLSRRIRWGPRGGEMAGALPCDVEMSERPEAHGYVVLEETGAGPWPQAGRTLRGHEFHHSRITGLPRDARFAYRVLRGHGAGEGRDGLVVGNCVACYTHLHAAGAPGWAADFVAAALRRAPGRATS